MQKALLILEDGTVFEGRAVGAVRDSISEIVFNTSMTGYVEVLTDPSYAGQMICMTYPLMGNYGVKECDAESPRIWADGFICRELNSGLGNSRREIPLEQWLIDNDLPGICGIDTRRLTTILREKGTMNGMITTRTDLPVDAALAQIKAYQTGNVVERTTGKASFLIPGDGPRVALMDYGAKSNIVQSLVRRGCQVMVYPASTPAETVLAAHPDGILLSNGPGDPKCCGAAIAQVRKFYESDLPIFAICLGHQLMALATGANTVKLKYGHRGGNHPVKNPQTGRIYMTAQNHGYAVDPSSIDPAVAVPAYLNGNDGTNEGLRYPGKKILSVQFHPEAAPGPQDTNFLFDEFLRMMQQ